MIRKPPQGWDRESGSIVAARATAAAARRGVEFGVAAAPRALHLGKALAGGFFALIWGWCALMTFIFGLWPLTLLIGAMTFGMARMAVREFARARHGETATPPKQDIWAAYRSVTKPWP